MYIAGRTGINFQIMTNRTYWNTRKTEYLVSLGKIATFSSLVNLLISTSSLYQSLCYMGFTRRAVVNPIQIRREYCIVLKVRMHLKNHVNQLFW